MKTITVRLPGPLAAWLSREARERGQSQSELVRDALGRYRKGDDSASCHDLLEDLCGSFKGARNLSIDPKYLNGFGKQGKRI
jgi:Arc/MetJ-type ribon-helix-helix transcriptional regulator